MAFYLKPPKGGIPLHRLLDLAVGRLQFLMKLVSAKDGSSLSLAEFLKQNGQVEDSEYLIEGSAKDRIAHFILRLTCLHSQEKRNAFIEAEVLFFKLRLLEMTSKEKHNMLKVARRHLMELVNEAAQQSTATSELVSVLHSVIHQVVIKKLVHISSLDAIDKHITVPFQYALQLISTRSVNLIGGIAFVPIEKMNCLLENLFMLWLQSQTDISYLKFLEICMQDERIWFLYGKIEEVFEESRSSSMGSSPTPRLLHTQIDQVSHLFPPCMRVLHEKLRHCHRLRHSARVEYTLFLKEIGLPVKDSFLFWQTEYSRPNAGCNPGTSKCSHDWVSNEKRYTYSIRHLYGLEGSRRNYTARSCTSIQSNVLGSLDEGGCPFKHFDADNLKRCLFRWDVNDGDVRMILDEVENGHFTGCCSKFLACTLPCKREVENASCYECRPTSDVTHSVGFALGSDLLKGCRQQTAQGKPLFSKPSEFYFLKSKFA